MIGSAFGQDAWVIQMLGGQRGGFFLDSGASDGVRGSNTLLLETEYGWNGICVEPNPVFFAALVRQRRCQCVCCCLYDRDGEVPFVDAQVLGGIAQDYPPSLLRQARATYGVAVDADGRPATVLRPARAIPALLRELAAPPVIDYWSLDTEGSELSILRAFPFDQYRVRLLTIEHNWLPVREEIHAFMRARGYRRVGELAVDDCYVEEATATSSAAPSAWRSGAWRRRGAA